MNRFVPVEVQESRKRIKQQRKNVLSYDRETTVGMYMGRKASPFDPSNYEVACAWKQLKEDKVNYVYRKDRHAPCVKLPFDGVLYLVGFNIKFDNLWQWDTPEFREFFASGGKIWDCQLAAYMLTGQIMNMKAGDMTRPSMNNVSRVLKGQSKIDEVKALWDAGVDTPDIPYDLLMTYLVGSKDMGTENQFGDVWGDVRTTEYIFKCQVQQARDKGMMAQLQMRMDGLLATTDMEFNGLYIDKELGELRTKQLEAAVEELSCELNDMLPPLPPLEKQWNPDKPYKFNWGSWQQKSALFYGGTVKYDGFELMYNEDGSPTYFKKTEKWPLFDGEAIDPAVCTLIGCDTYMYYDQVQDTYKSGKNAGQPKFKNVTVDDVERGQKRKKLEGLIWEFPRMIEPEDDWALAQDGYWSTNAETIDLIGKMYGDEIPFVEVLAVYTWLEKDLKTYYKRWSPNKNDYVGMLTLVQPDNIIHHNLNTCETGTTRLSSSKPNMQNLPRDTNSKVKELFVSRFGDDGFMVEADWASVEVVTKAWNSRDPNLIADLQAGTDMHAKRLSFKLGMDYADVKAILDDEEHPEHTNYKLSRQNIKPYSFQSQYGGGLQLMAKATGMSVDQIKEIKEREDEYYAEAKAFDDMVLATVEANAYSPSNVYTDSGYPAQRGWYQTPSGTIYMFTQRDAPAFMHKHGTYATFYKPHIMNYPTQGLGGEVAYMALGKLFRHFAELNNYCGKAFLVNTVHDCIWIDAHKDVVHQVIHDVKLIMEHIPRYFVEYFDWKSPVPFPVEIEYGKNMYELKVFHDYKHEDYPTPYTSAWKPEYIEGGVVAYYNLETNEPVYKEI